MDDPTCFPIDVAKQISQCFFEVVSARFNSLNHLQLADFFATLTASSEALASQSLPVHDLIARVVEVLRTKVISMDKSDQPNEEGVRSYQLGSSDGGHFPDGQSSPVKQEGNSKQGRNSKQKGRQFSLKRRSRKPRASLPRKPDSPENKFLVRCLMGLALSPGQYCGFQDVLFPVVCRKLDDFSGKTSSD